MMPDPLPNAEQTLRAIQAVNAARGPVDRMLTAISQVLAMPRDKRYTMSVVCRLGVPIGITAGVLNFIFWNYLFAIPFVAPFVERAILIGLAIAVFAILVSELKRYRAVLAYIEQYGTPNGGNS